MGFAVYRIDNKDKETPLPSHAVFKGDTIKPGQTTDSFPMQKFYWKDLYARLVAEKTGNRKFRYKVVPLEGQAAAPQADDICRSSSRTKSRFRRRVSAEHERLLQPRTDLHAAHFRAR